ncbi:stage VI sporulation protein D [Bacillus sp. SCS-151]|uniref:stage VI sporulation protein D n=1 Tax=Nanhaiella sioensis TaxID=3115293 RepID=UPI00397D4A6C
MTQEEQSSLRFSIEESVWFQKGQEVSELLSISLDPDIMIEEHDQYITIRGSLQLSGEYRIDENAVHEDVREFPGRVVNTIITREDGVSELKHVFPVDITIPKTRIDRMDDVYISINSFDYEIPQTRCLEVFADLSISGIYDHHQSEVIREGEYYEEIIEHEEGKEGTERVEVNDVDSMGNVKDGEDVVHVGIEEDLYDPFEVEVRKQVEEDVLDSAESAESNVPNVDVYSPQVELKGREETDLVLNFERHSEERNEVQTKEIKVREEAMIGDESEAKRDENALYLTKIFGKEEHESDFSQVKMCFVQQGDSVQSISERYDVSVQQLLRVNHLEQEHDIYEGQILYIPIYIDSKV